MGSFRVEERDGKQMLCIEMGPFNTQVLPYYGQYDTNKPTLGICTNYQLPNNVCGHTQRAFIQYWALRSFIETGLVGVELGSAGVVAPMCISTDILGNGESHENYGGIMGGVQIKLDAADLGIFQTASLSCVLSSHVLEHVSCLRLRGNETPEQKIQIACNAIELIDIFRNHWLRVLVPGGYFCAVFPEEGAANRGGHSVFHQDLQHQHAIRADRFRSDVIQPLVDEGLVEVIEYDTFQNNFSCNVALRRR